MCVSSVCTIINTEDHLCSTWEEKFTDAFYLFESDGLSFTMCIALGAAMFIQCHSTASLISQISQLEVYPQVAFNCNFNLCNSDLDTVQDTDYSQIK